MEKKAALQLALEHVEQKREKSLPNHILPKIELPDLPVSLGYRSTADVVYCTQA